MIVALQFLIQFFASFWKVYVGASIAVLFHFSLVPMLLANLLGMSCSVFLFVFISDFLQSRHQRPAQGFNRHLRTALKYWRKFGKNGAALLAPIVLGIPVYTFIARRFRMSVTAILGRLMLSSLLWCLLFYYASQQGLILTEQFIHFPDFLAPYFPALIP